MERAISAQNDVNSSWVLIEEILYETKIDVAANFFTGYVGIQNFEDLLIHLENSKIYHEAGIPFEKLSEIIKESSIDAVCRQADQLDIRKSVEDLQFDAQVNIIRTINIFEACIKNGVKKVVFASSGFKLPKL